jgi:hypothetical protein
VSIKPVVERIALFAEGKGTVDGCVGTGKRQPEKFPETPRIPKLKRKIILARLLGIFAR